MLWYKQAMIGIEDSLLLISRLDAYVVKTPVDI